MLAKQKLAASAPVRPALNTIEPFASLNARWAEMTRREDELTAELRPLVAEIRAAGGYAERGGVPVRPAAGPERLPPRRRELVADLVPFRRPGRRRRSATSTARRRERPRSAPNWPTSPRRKSACLPALNRARAEASAKVCDAVAARVCGDRPAHRRGADRAGRGWNAQTVFLHELAAEGVSTSTLRQIVIHGLDDPLDTIGRALHWAAECGYIDPNAVPPEWLAR